MVLSSAGIICYFVIPFFCSCAEAADQIVLLKLLKLFWRISQIRPGQALFAKYFYIFKGSVVTPMALLLSFYAFLETTAVVDMTAVKLD